MLRYGTNKYEVIVTNKRLLMFARRGLIVRGDDVISFRMEDLQGVKYREEGIVLKMGTIQIQGKTTIQLIGLASEAKMVYQQLMQFL